LMLARRIAFDSLEFRDCLVQVTETDVTPGADGILGASLFERFRLRIDSGAHKLELTPGEPDQIAASEPGQIAPGEPGQIRDAPRALSLDRLLLVRANVNAVRDGWFLLDTGAAYTTLSPALSAPQFSLQPMNLSGMQGASGGWRL